MRGCYNLNIFEGEFMNSNTNTIDSGLEDLLVRKDLMNLSQWSGDKKAFITFARRNNLTVYVLGGFTYLEKRTFEQALEGFLKEQKKIQYLKRLKNRILYKLKQRNLYLKFIFYKF
jgi:hypothetical protein